MADELEGIFQGKWNLGAVVILFFMFLAAVVIAIEASPFATKEELAQVEKQTAENSAKIEDLKTVVTDIATIKQRISDMEDPGLPMVGNKKHKKGD